ncbi:hypothetical protein XENOCAPTIV_024195 [Xenoophorus captivus]|uniref:Uncharacterized protein n=1 Tax=Xenoophorus captivus TaxID=1517983 RepID=A0ABV0S8H4_9TELE
MPETLSAISITGTWWSSLTSSQTHSWSCQEAGKSRLTLKESHSLWITTAEPQPLSTLGSHCRTADCQATLLTDSTCRDSEATVLERYMQQPVLLITHFILESFC